MPPGPLGSASAGTFDTFRVEMNALDGAPGQMTLSVAKEPRKAVKMAATMAPATISAALK